MKHDDDGNYDKLQIRGSLMMNIMMTVMILTNNYDCDDGAQWSLQTQPTTLMLRAAFAGLWHV